MSKINITRAEQGEHWLVGGETTTIKVSGKETDGELFVVETSVPPGGGPNLVRHEFIETFYVVEGEFEFGTGGVKEDGEPETISAGVGDTVFVPSMAWHSYKNVGGSRGRLLTTFATAAIEDLARLIGQKVEDPANPPAAAENSSSEEEQRRAQEIMQEYSIEIMSPDNPRN